MRYKMKRKIIIVLSVLFTLTLSLTSLLLVSVWAADDDSVTEIKTAGDLKALADDPTRWGGKFKLTADINLNGNADDQWTTIGKNNDTKFTGIFDGDNHTISGLYIENNYEYQGLFGYVSDGTIKNLKVNGTVIGRTHVGGIVGQLDFGTIEKCSFEGTVEGGLDGEGTEVGGIVGFNHYGTIKECRKGGTVLCGSMYAGGIVGHNEGAKESNAIVSGCENTGTVSLLDGKTTVSTAGGIIGINRNGTIINCINKGDIGTGENLLIGGIVGTNNSASVTNCYNEGKVKGSSNIGGIAGQNTASASIEHCYNLNTVSGSTNYIGGVAGQNDDKASVTICYNAATVSGVNYIGGIVGQNLGKATVTNCYNKAAISGTGFIGGIVGRNHNGGSSKSFSSGVTANCYNKGTVTGNKSNSGSIVGQNVHTNGSAGTVTNCYYLTGGTVSGGIAGSDAIGSAEVKTEEKFKSGEVSWLLQKGNTVNNIWGQEIVKSTKDAYPLLISIPEGASGALDDTRTGDKAVPIVARISFFVPDENVKAYKQLTENESNEYYVQYTNENGKQGNGLGNIKLPTHSDHDGVPEKSQDESAIRWLVNNPNGEREFSTVVKEDIIWDSSKSNEIYLYVKWKFAPEYSLGFLTIKATGGRPNENFIYHVTGTIEDGTEIELTVSVKSGSSTRLVLPVGSYTVTEISDWSWKYKDGVPQAEATSIASGMISEDAPIDWTISGKSVQLTLNESIEVTVTYAYTRNNKRWRGGEYSTD